MEDLARRREMKSMYIGKAYPVPHECKTCKFEWNEGMYYERDTNYEGYVLEDGGTCPYCGEEDENKVGKKENLK